MDIAPKVFHRNCFPLSEARHCRPPSHLELINGRILPRLVHGLQPKHGRMTPIQLHDLLQHLQGVLNILPINFINLQAGSIEVPHPTCRSDGPMLECCQASRVQIYFRRPLKPHGLTRVVKSILTAFHTVDVEEDGEAILICPIKQKLHIVIGSVSAPDCYLCVCICRLT